jgi:hypothetical protein
MTTAESFSQRRGNVVIAVASLSRNRRGRLGLGNQRPRLAFNWMEIIEATNTNLRAIQ